MTPKSETASSCEFGRRMRAQFGLKLFGIPCFMALFFLGYIQILKHAFLPVTVMPLTAIDRLIPYQTYAWFLYISLWVYVQLPLCLIDCRRELVRYGATAAGVSLVGFVFFIFWPTAVPITAVDATDSLLAGIRTIDTTGNSCPSLHVAFAVFTAVWIERFLGKIRISVLIRLLNFGWCLGIIYSTLATKQHVVLDACAGAGLGLVGASIQACLGETHRGQPAVAPTSPGLAQIRPAARKL